MMYFYYINFVYYYYKKDDLLKEVIYLFRYTIRGTLVVQAVQYNLTQIQFTNELDLGKVL